MIRQSDSIHLLDTRGDLRTVTTKENIEKVKNCLQRKQKISARKLSMEHDISATNVR